LLPLSVDEFLCRFLLHILPQGFVRIRHFGFLATGGVPRFCRFAFSCWAQPKSRSWTTRERNIATRLKAET